MRKDASGPLVDLELAVTWNCFEHKETVLHAFEHTSLSSNVEEEFKNGKVPLRAKVHVQATWLT